MPSLPTIVVGGGSANFGFAMDTQVLSLALEQGELALFQFSLCDPAQNLLAQVGGIAISLGRSKEVGLHQEVYGA